MKRYRTAFDFLFFRLLAPGFCILFSFLPHPFAQTLLRVSRPMMATKIVAPMIDQTMGNDVSPILSM